MKPWLCRITPYYHRDLRGVLRGMKDDFDWWARHGWKISWGIGHPTWRVNFGEDKTNHADSTVTCTRCGHTQPMLGYKKKAEV